MTKISIVTVTYNDSPNLAATIRSVAAQVEAPSFQYIIQDGASSDGTDKLVEAFGDAVDCFCSEPDRGIYDAMNKSLKHVCGEYTLFLNAADLLPDRDTLKTIAAAMRDDDEILTGRALSLETGKRHKHKPRNMFWQGMTFDHQAALVRSDILMRFGFDTSLRISGDLDFFSKARVAGYKFREIDVDFAKKPYLGGQSDDWIQRFSERQKVLSTHYGADYPVNEKLFDELVGYLGRNHGCDQDWLRREYEDIFELSKFAEFICN